MRVFRVPILPIESNCNIFEGATDLSCGLENLTSTSAPVIFLRLRLCSFHGWRPRATVGEGRVDLFSSFTRPMIMAPRTWTHNSYSKLVYHMFWVKTCYTSIIHLCIEREREIAMTLVTACICMYNSDTCKFIVIYDYIYICIYIVWWIAICLYIYTYVCDYIHI